jgi:two-component system cell cycle response regulator
MIPSEFEELKHSGKLPSPSAIGMRILMLTQQEDWVLDELVRTMQADPALTGRILKVANTAIRSGTGNVNTVNEAAMRLGVKTVRNVALAFTLITGNRSGACEEFDYDDYWASSLMTAVAAQRISLHTGKGAPGEAFTCALLGRVGELALASVHPNEYGQLLRTAHQNAKADIAKLETEAFSINQFEVSMSLAQDWGLPRAYSTAIGFHRQRVPTEEITDALARQLINMLRVGKAVAEYCTASEKRQREQWPLIQKLRERLGIDSVDFVNLCDEILEESAEWARLLELPDQEHTPMAVVEARASQAVAESRAVEEDAQFTVGERCVILAVDDEPVSLRPLSRHLEQMGHRVLTARNGKEALAIALKETPQLVVTDWMMPEMDGIELCRALRRYPAGRNIYVVIVTGRDDEDRVVEAFEAGADDYVTKPFRPRLLGARIRGGQRVVRLQKQVDHDKRVQRDSVAKLAVLTRKLRAAAMTDPLTQLPNRRFAMKRLSEEWSNAKSLDLPFTAVMLDVDFFKHVNDTYGHDIGDEVLVRVSHRIRDTIRGGDACARMGGEEFLIICPNTAIEGGQLCAERIRKAVEEEVIRTSDGSEVKVTISLGVGTREAGMASVEDLIKMADEAVFKAKESGRNCTVTGVWTRGNKKSA